MKKSAMLGTGESVELAGIGARVVARVIDTVPMLYAAAFVTIAIEWNADPGD